MRNYYYTDGKNRFGPFSLDEIKRQGLPGHALIWHPGLNGWIKKSEIAELNHQYLKPQAIRHNYIS